MHNTFVKGYSIKSNYLFTGINGSILLKTKEHKNSNNSNKDKHLKKLNRKIQYIVVVFSLSKMTRIN